MLCASVVVRVPRTHDVRCLTRGVQHLCGVRTEGNPAMEDTTENCIALGDGRLVLTRRRGRGTLKPVALLVSPAVEGYAMAMLTIRAIYEDGKLRPLQLLPLQEHECVLVQVLRQCTVAETSGLLPGLPLAIIREVAEGKGYSVLS